MGGGGKKAQTIGYRYFMSLMFGLGRGEVNDLVEVQVGNLLAWAGQGSGDGPPSSIYINKPDLFGGDKKEGGIQGTLEIFNGGPTQIFPSAHKGLMGGLLPDFRGAVTMWFDGLIGSMNPYPKEWKFRVRRSTKGWHPGTAWNLGQALIPLGADTASPELPDDAYDPENYGLLSLFILQLRREATDSASVTSIHAMNGAHMIYEALTNGAWGGGEPVDTIAEDSFLKAAGQLHDEGLGLCMKWARKEEVDTFIQSVLDHIGGMLYTDRRTGLWTLKLVRDDYSIGDLQVFDAKHGLVSIVEDDSSSQDGAHNEIIVTYRDPITNKDASVRAQNPAAFQVQGGPVSISRQYPGAPTKEVAGRLALRDLQLEGSGLKKFTVQVNRLGSNLNPGDVFAVRAPKRGIGFIVLRAGEIDDGVLTNGVMTIKCVEDVFAFPSTSLVTPQDPRWTPPPELALPPRAHRLIEMNYRDQFLRGNPADIAAVTPDETHVGELAVAPNGTSLQFELLTKPEGGPTYIDQGAASFCGSAVLAADIGREDTTMILKLEQDFPEDYIGDAWVIDDEVMRIDAYDPATHIMTVARGCADTIPQAHLADTRCFMPDDDMAADPTIYAEGETVFAKALTRTSNDLLPESFFPDPDVVTTINRFWRPYPPADARLQVGHRYYRMFIEQVGDGGNTVSIQWFRLLDGNGAEMEGAYTASTELSGDYPIDGAKAMGGTFWASNGAMPQWLMVDLGEDPVVEPIAYKVQVREDGFFTNVQGPVAWRVQFSDDLDTWTDVDQRVGQAPWTPAEVRTFPVVTTAFEDVAFGPIYPQPTLTWKNRNRITQEDKLIGQEEATIEPEAGQTVTVVVLDGPGTTILGTHEGITGNQWTYDTAAHGADGSPASVTLRLYSERDGVRSWAYRETKIVMATGYGLGYGSNYGGSE